MYMPSAFLLAWCTHVHTMHIHTSTVLTQPPVTVTVTVTVTHLPAGRLDPRNASACTQCALLSRHGSHFPQNAARDVLRNTPSQPAP